MDFGIARAVADTSATMTQTAAVIGTAQYLSPEQARGETVDARSDLYSAGCLLYELLVGRPPFVGDSPVSVAYQHVREAPVPPSQLDPEITSRDRRGRPEGAGQGPGRPLPVRQRDEGRHQSLALRRNRPPPSKQPPWCRWQPERWLPTLTTPPPTWLGRQPSFRLRRREEEYEEEEPQKSRVGLAILIGALIVLALGLGGWALYRMLNPTNTVETVAVPHVLGLTEQQARRPAHRRTTSSSKSRRKTATRRPKARLRRKIRSLRPNVEVNSTVTITLNEGPETATIPDGLVGQDRQGRQELSGESEVSATSRRTRPRARTLIPSPVR